MDDLPMSPIKMPQLVNLIVSANCADAFVLLNRLLRPHVDVKRRLEAHEDCSLISSITFHRSLTLRMYLSTSISQERRGESGVVCGLGTRSRPGRMPSSVALSSGLSFKNQA